MEYIKRFRDITLDCYDHCEEKKNIGGNVYDKYDQGVQSHLRILGNLLICTVVPEGQEDCSINEAKLKQKKCSTSYSSIHW